MKDETMLAEQLRALLEAHGPADLLRAMSASALGLAEKAPDDDNQWINAAAATAQAAEALTDDDDHGVVDDDAGESDAEENGDEEEEDDGAAPSEAGDSSATTSPPPAPSSSSSEGAADMRDQDFAPRKDATHWRAYRLTDDGKKSIPLFWGDNGVERSQWARKEFSPEAVRARWGVGRYVIWWYGVSVEGKLVSLGRGHELRIVERPRDVREPEPSRAAPSSPDVSSASNGSSELLAALSALRTPNPSAPAVGGGADMTVVLQVLAFMEDSRERQARAAEAHLRAEREITMERERLASKERIAQIEANAHAAARGGGRGVDTEALAEVIGRKVQEVIEGSGDDDDSAALATRPSDVATIANALKETIAPLVTMFIQNAMTKPSGNGSNGSN